MTVNEEKFVDVIVNLDQKILEARQYIKENFGVYSDYNDEERMLNLYVNNINEGLQIMAAKEYIENSFEPGLLALNV